MDNAVLVCALILFVLPLFSILRHRLGIVLENVLWCRRADKITSLLDDPNFWSLRVLAAAETSFDRWVVLTSCDLKRERVFYFNKGMVSYRPESGDSLRIYCRDIDSKIIHGAVLNDTVLYWHHPTRRDQQ